MLSQSMPAMGSMRKKMFCRMEKEIQEKRRVGTLSRKKPAADWLIRAVMKQKRAVAAASPAVVVYCTSEITLRSTMKNRNSAITGAIRAMKPQLIITDELYGDEDISAMQYAVDCGIYVIASTHVCNKDILKTMPFEYFAELTGIGENPLIYDKNFNIVGSGGADNVDRNIFIGK